MGKESVVNFVDSLITGAAKSALAPIDAVAEIIRDGDVSEETSERLLGGELKDGLLEDDG